MKVSITLIKSDPYNQDGYPISLRVAHGSKKPQKTIGRAWPEHFDDKMQMITDEHPDYDVLAPKIMNYKLKARKLVISGEITDPQALLAELEKTPSSSITLKQFADAWIAEKNELRDMHEKKGEVKERNNIDGYVRSVRNAMEQFQLSCPDIRIDALDYDALKKFKKARQLAGNTANTVHLYLRTIRQMYNKACLEHKIENKQPFKGIFSGLAIRSSQGRKKYLDIEAVRVLESLVLTGERERSRDLWLLQFYFGGCDLIDIYFLKKVQVRKGRVRFERGKVHTGRIIDLKVHPKAAAIMEKYPGEGEWQFPWRKDAEGYDTFRNNHGKMLKQIQKEQNAAADAEKKKELRVDVLPEGGNLAIKVARHTFGNAGKRHFVDDDLLRELMGHERNDVDNWYKDKYPEKVRDEALFKIIG